MESLDVRKVQHPIKPRLLRVKHITDLSPYLRRITLTGDDLAGFHTAAFDDHVKLLLPDARGAQPRMPGLGPNGLVFDADQPRPVMRDYTPRRYDDERNELDIDFVLGHDGPATDWAQEAEPGHFIGTAGPRGSFIIPSAFDWHLLVGDETAIPAIARRLEELPASVQAIVIIKVRSEDARIELPAECRVDLRWVIGEHLGATHAESGGPQSPSSGAETEPGLLASELQGISLPRGEGYAWAAGEYGEIKAVRAHLIEERGIRKDRIRAASYWRQAAPGSHERF